jgi:hypothetical protein
VRVEPAAAAGRFGAGLRVSAPCAVLASELGVEGATYGISVSGAAATPADVALTAATITDCERGVDLVAGRLAIEASTIEHNEMEGIVAVDERSLERELTVIDTRLAHNGDGALLLQLNRKLDLRGNTICGNDAVTQRVEAQTNRLAGGIVVADEPPAELVFRGNRVFSNTGDQLLVAAATRVWSFRGAADLAACSSSADANYFAGYLGTTSRGVYAASASVDARYNLWESPAPAPSRDYEAVGGVVTGGTATTGGYCPSPTPLPPCD